MVSLQVTCISKCESTSGPGSEEARSLPVMSTLERDQSRCDRPHERIDQIGGIGWRHTQQEGIENVEASPRAYHVSVAGGSVWVTIGIHNGRKYLTTEPDGSSRNHLLALPECPA